MYDDISKSYEQKARVLEMMELQGVDMPLPLRLFYVDFLDKHGISHESTTSLNAAIAKTAAYFAEHKIETVDQVLNAPAFKSVSHYAQFLESRDL